MEQHRHIMLPETLKAGTLLCSKRTQDMVGDSMGFCSPRCGAPRNKSRDSEPRLVPSEMEHHKFKRGDSCFSQQPEWCILPDEEKGSPARRLARLLGRRLVVVGRDLHQDHYVRSYGSLLEEEKEFIDMVHNCSALEESHCGALCSKGTIGSGSSALLAKEKMDNPSSTTHGAIATPGDNASPYRRVVRESYRKRADGLWVGRGLRENVLHVKDPTSILLFHEEPSTITIVEESAKAAAQKCVGNKGFSGTPNWMRMDRGGIVKSNLICRQTAAPLSQLTTKASWTDLATEESVDSSVVPIVTVGRSKREGLPVTALSVRHMSSSPKDECRGAASDVGGHACVSYNKQSTIEQLCVKLDKVKSIRLTQGDTKKVNHNRFSSPGNILAIICGRSRPKGASGYLFGFFLLAVSMRYGSGRPRMLGLCTSYRWLPELVNEVPFDTILNPKDISFRSTVEMILYEKCVNESNGTFCLSLDFINSGTFCTVFGGRFRHRDVAVKCPQKRLLKYEPEATRFRALQEWRILAKARPHRNILNLVGGASLSTHELWIVTERISGGDLQSRLHWDKSGCENGLQRRRRLSAPLRLSIMKQVADALAYLHGRQPSMIVHKDLKASNILIVDEDDNGRTENTEGCRVVLCDFGDAEEIRQGSSLQTYTAVTWQYAPPEIILLNDPAHPGQDATEKVDIWSLGCLYMELCYQDSPFSLVLNNVGVSCHQKALQLYLLDTLRKTAQKSLKTRLPPYLARLLESCLRLNPTRRPSATAVRIYLEKYDAEVRQELVELEALSRLGQK